MNQLDEKRQYVEVSFTGWIYKAQQVECNIITASSVTIILCLYIQ